MEIKKMNFTFKFLFAKTKELIIKTSVQRDDIEAAKREAIKTFKSFHRERDYVISAEQMERK